MWLSKYTNSVPLFDLRERYFSILRVPIDIFLFASESLDIIEELWFAFHFFMNVRARFTALYGLLLSPFKVDY